MKRWLVRICVLLILGAIVNVAVAWGCTFGLRFRSGTSPSWHDEKVDLVLREHGWAADGMQPMAGCDRRLGAMEGHVITFVGGNAVQVMLLARSGWPGYALEGIMIWPHDAYAKWSQSGGGPRVSGSVIQGAWPYNTWVNYPTFKSQGTLLIPWRPIWPGFAINTVFYAAVLWLLFAAPFALRRRRRIKRGLCPKCAYDLRGSVGACPECGFVPDR